MLFKLSICSLTCLHVLMASASMASEPKHAVAETVHEPTHAEPASPPEAESEKPVTHMAAPEHAAPLHEEKPEMVPATDLASSTLDRDKFGTDGFLKTRRRLVQKITEGESGLSLSAENIKALLDLAEFFLSHAFLVESRSILTSLEPASLSPEQMDRKQIISLAVSLLNPMEKPLSEKEIQTLEALDAWPRKTLFLSLHYIGTDQPQKAKPLLEQAAKEVAMLSTSIQELTLPQLLETAINTKSWAAAKEFAKLVTEHSHLKDSSAYQYLLGKTSAAGEDYLVAFDNFVKASEGTDQWAQRARLALVELGTKTNTLSPEDARELLSESRFLWRGDALALKTLDRLVEAELAVNDVPAALEVLGEIIYINLDEDSTQAAKEHANILIKDYYEKGAAGKIELSQFILGHQRISNDYRFQAGYSKFSELFADRMFQIGASSEAAREYDTTYNYLSVAQDLGLFDVEAEKLDKLRVKQVKALMRGGQYDEALSVLASGPQSQKQELVDEFTFLKVELFSHIGDMSELLKEKAHEPSADYLRIKAKAYIAMEDWKNALETYRQLWAQENGSLSFTEAVNMLLAAYHEKDADLALKLVKTFPDLTDAPQWQEIATGLFSKNEVDGILRKEVVSGNISKASRVLDVMDIINTSSQ